MINPHAAGLAHLMGRLQDRKEFKKNYWRDRDNNHASFTQHPFGHSVELSRAGGGNHTTYLVADPRVTDLSVRAMLLMLQYQLIGIPGTDCGFRLRITRVQVDRDWHNNSRFIHDLYFELVSWNGTFICAGCNDYSGGGGQGGRELEAIFNLVGFILPIPVEEIVIPMGRHEEIDHLFRDTYDRHRQAKLAA